MTSVDDQLRALEVELLTFSTRRDSARLRSLLHEEFVEIGRSGRRFDRAEIVSALTHETPRSTPAMDEWQSLPLSSSLVLVTYRLSREDSVSRHSSVWDVGADPFLLRFHQGTVVS